MLQRKNRSKFILDFLCYHFRLCFRIVVSVSFLKKHWQNSAWVFFECGKNVCVGESVVIRNTGIYGKEPCLEEHFIVPAS